MLRVVVAAAALLPALPFAQADRSVRALVRAGEPLSPLAITRLLDETKGLMAGKTFVAHGGFGAGEFQMGPGGRLRFANTGGRLTEYTGKAARTCAGPILPGELVIEYSRRFGDWTASARASREIEPLQPVLDLWARSPLGIEDTGIKEIDGKRARGLRFPYRKPAAADAAFNATSQVLYFDLETLLPIRWVLEVERPEALEYGYRFDFRTDFSIAPPAGVDPPECIS